MAVDMDPADVQSALSVSQTDCLRVLPMPSQALGDSVAKLMEQRREEVVPVPVV